MNNNDICWVCFPLRDGMDSLHGDLALLRREFFLKNRKTVRASAIETVKGFNGRLRGKISRRSMYWKKSANGTTGGSVVLEEAFGRTEGWLLVVRDFRGGIVSRTYFDKSHAWLKSEYYEPWDPNVARVAFLRSQGPGLVERQDWDQEKSAYRSCQLYPAPYRSGTAEQNLIDAQLGQPLLVLLTTVGELCCCSKAQAEQREKAQEEGAGGTMVLMPAWEVKEGELVSEAGEDEDAAISFTSLEEYAKIEPAAPEAPPEGAAGGPAAYRQAEEGVLELSHNIPTFDPPTEEPTSEGFTGHTEDDSADAPAVSAQEEAPTESAAADEAQGAAAGNPPEINSVSEPPEGKADSREKLTDRSYADAPAVPAQEEAPIENTAADEAKGAVEWNPQDDIPTEILEELTAGVSASLPSVKPVAAQPMPAGYQGDVRNGRATGKGRMVQPGGRTSYEGDYLDGKRHGFGAYYYKDGSLCYAGFWENDQRSGPGVSFRDSDHAMHIANWKEGQPQGLVSLFDGSGNLRYSGRFENGKKEGAGVVINGQDGTVFVGQWSGGEATGLGSAFDRDGRLLYYGAWKDGKRHGHGTEFDMNGGVVFDGEFREDKYYNGVLYQKLTQPEWEQ